MKEATGELNVTVITVVAIAAVAAFFYAFIWPAIQNSLMSATACSNAAPGLTQGEFGEAGYISCNNTVNKTTGNYRCTYYKKTGQSSTITCTQKQS